MLRFWFVGLTVSVIVIVVIIVIALLAIVVVIIVLLIVAVVVVLMRVVPATNQHHLHHCSVFVLIVPVKYLSTSTSVICGLAAKPLLGHRGKVAQRRFRVSEKTNPHAGFLFVY